MLDADAIYKKVLESGEEYADLKATYRMLDESTKSVLAQGVQAYRPDSESHAEALSRALASTPYRDHLAAVALAHAAYLKAQVRYESAKMLSELRRTQESSKRAEMNLR